MRTDRRGKIEAGEVMVGAAETQPGGVQDDAAIMGHAISEASGRRQRFGIGADLDAETPVGARQVAQFGP